MNLSKRFSIILAGAITVVALFLAFREVELRNIFAHISSGRYIYMIPAFLCLMIYCYFRAVRWGVFFDRNINLKILFSATMIGLMANNIFPARAGEFLKAYILGKRESMSKSACFATVVLERLWDGITVIFLIGIMLLWMVLSGETIFSKSSQHISFKYISGIFILFYLLIFTFLLIWKFYSKNLVIFIRWLLSFFSSRLADFISIRLVKFTEGLIIFQNLRKMFIVTFYSFIIWISAALTLYLMLEVFSFDLTLPASFFLLIIIGLFVMIPSWGSLGTMQMAFIVGLAAFGINKSNALSFSFVYQFFDTIPVVLIGLVYFWKEGLTFQKLNKVKEELNERA